VGGGGGGEADLDGVEVVEGVAPDGELLAGVAAVAFVGDDEVEGVDGDVEASASSSPDSSRRRPRRRRPKRLMAMRWMVQT
jgi:hypothetical protein